MAVRTSYLTYKEWSIKAFYLSLGVLIAVYLLKNINFHWKIVSALWWWSQLRFPYSSISKEISCQEKYMLVLVYPQHSAALALGIFSFSQQWTLQQIQWRHLAQCGGSTERTFSTLFIETEDMLQCNFVCVRACMCKRTHVHACKTIKTISI